MLATAWETVFSDDGWVFELKWDGIRCLLTSDAGTVRLHSRAGNEMTDRYPELANLSVPDGVVLDGEIVALDDHGRPSFELLQGRMNITRLGSDTSARPISFVAFDVLHDGESLVDLRLEERAEHLDQLALPAPIVGGERFAGDVQAVWDFVLENDLEGIVAKRLGSRYRSGTRSADWRKIGNYKQLRAVVGGFTRGSGGRAQTFGALLLGLWTDEGLRFIGSVGSGFGDTQLRSIRSAMDEMRTVASPFAQQPETAAEATWIDPNLVAMIRYKQWTAAGRMRAPSFKGFTDTPPSAASWKLEGPGASL